MTLIECFTNSHIDNVMACLRLHPDKVIFIGNEDEMQMCVPRYKKVLQQRGLLPQIIMQDSREKDIEDLFDIFNRIVSGDDTYTIDLTGGSESALVAIGAVLAVLDPAKAPNVRVERFDRKRNLVVDCIHDKPAPSDGPVQITVSELIELHGGCLHPDAFQPPEDCKYTDLEGLWKVSADSPKDWNHTIMLLREFESRSESKTDIFLPIGVLRGSVSNADEKEPIVRALLDKLQRNGVIRDFSTPNRLEYTYQSDWLRYCTLKAGNVLEMKTLLEGRATLQDGAVFFHDCKMGVGIDWDGMVYGPEDQIPETRNEVDAVFMHGTTPLFISCKNGNVSEDELYKLHTIATRFGGPYARKMLIATHLERKSFAANRAFIQRADDMNITLVTNAAALTHEQWQQKLINALK